MVLWALLFAFGKGTGDAAQNADDDPVLAVNGVEQDVSEAQNKRFCVFSVVVDFPDGLLFLFGQAFETIGLDGFVFSRRFGFIGVPESVVKHGGLPPKNGCTRAGMDASAR